LYGINISDNAGAFSVFTPLQSLLVISYISYYYGPCYLIQINDLIRLD